MTRYPTCANQCPACGHVFRTLEDEYGSHPCPRCGWGPGDETEDTDE